jgi:hypothetical protein
VRSITLEFRTDDLVALGLVPRHLFDRFDEVELLETLELDEGSRLELVRLRRRGPVRGAPELERESRRIRALYGLDSFEVVEVQPRTRDYILLVRQRNPDLLRKLLALAGGEIDPTAPFLLTPDRTVASFTGEEKAMRRVVARLDREEFPYRVLRASPRPRPAPREGAELTDLQGQLLARAWFLGYYAIPRRATLARLARASGRSAPAFGKVLRRAEGRLVARWLAAHGTIPDGALGETARTGRAPLPKEVARGA